MAHLLADPVERCGVQALSVQQMLGQQVCARTFLSAHEAQALGHDVLKAADAQRVASGHHQALRALHRAQQFVPARLQVGPKRLRVMLGPPHGRHMKAGHQTTTFGQRTQGVQTAREAQFDVQPAFGGLLLQAGQQQIVAGVHPQDVHVAVQGFIQHAAQLAAQGFNVGLKAHAGAALGPQQTFGKRGQARGLTPHPGDERLVQRSFPLAQAAPEMAVAQAHVLGRPLDGPFPRDGGQHVEQGVLDAAAVLGEVGKLVLEPDAAVLHARIVQGDGALAP